MSSDFFACEALEPRMLFAFFAHVNFEPSGAPVPGGYVADTGAVYGDRGNGFSYGWNAANANGIDRNSSLSKDQRYDTFDPMQKNGADASWEIAVPNGTYSVHLVAGDAIAIDSFYKISAENVVVVNAAPTSAQHWVEGTASVTVTDGRLTVANVAGSSKNKIDFIDINMTAPAVSIAAIDPDASEPGVDTGTFRVTRTGPTSFPLVVNYAIAGSATNGADYKTLGGAITIPAGSATADVLVTPLDDSLLENDETVNLTVKINKNYQVGSPSSAIVAIHDDDQPGLNQGLVALYNFDEGAGTTAADSSGNGNNGALTNGPTWVAGKIGKAVNFDGVNDYVSSPSSASLNPTAAISVAAWINVDSWTGGNKRIVQKGLSDNQYRLTEESGLLKFDLFGVTNGALTTALPTTGAWHEVIGTYDGASIKIYVDNVLVAQQAASGALATTTDPLFIGTKASNAGAGDWLDGRIDDVRIYNRALSASDVQALFNLATLPNVSIAATDASAAEPSNNGAFTISRSGPTTAALTVQYAISGTATNGSDYNTLTGSAIIPAGAASVNVNVVVKDDATPETTETVILTLVAGSGYNISLPDHDTVVIVDNDSANHPPNLPVIIEPSTEGELVSGFDVHMETQAFSDPDAGQTMSSSDWEIWTVGATPVRVWAADNLPGSAGTHFHFGDGTFQGPQAGQNKLAPDTDYQFRVRFRDNSGDPLTNASPWATRNFHTLPEQTATAAGWVAQQPGYRIEEVPFTFPTGELDWRLPTNIVFVPASIHGLHPDDPLFYVVELYGTIRVVTNNFTVHTYADNLLNYNPLGPISGNGENGLSDVAIDPTNGDLYATMLYDDPNDATTDTFPKVTRFTSNDGGITAATQTDILKMPGEKMHQSHIISNITFGPDGKLYVHVGDGLDNTQGENTLAFRGKILRLNKDGSAPTDNPHYNATDRNNDGLPDAEDYWYADGFRNPFGGAWRDPDPSVNRPAQHFTVENGPNLDRFSMLVRDRNYLYNGTDTSMQNYNIAYSPTGTFENGTADWQPAVAPVNVTFIQASNFNYSGFPSDKWGHAFVSTSGPTHASGPNNAKSIQEWVLNNDGTRKVPAAGQNNPVEIASYEGAGYATAAGLAAGPDGLYFTTLYPDTDPVGTNRGAKIYRIVYTGTTSGPAITQAAATMTTTAALTTTASTNQTSTTSNVIKSIETENNLTAHGAHANAPAFVTRGNSDGAFDTGSPFSGVPIAGVLKKDSDELFG